MPPDMPDVSAMGVGVKNHTYLRITALYHTTLAMLNSSLPGLCELVMWLTSSSRKLLCPAPTIALLFLLISSFFFFFHLFWSFYPDLHFIIPSAVALYCFIYENKQNFHHVHKEASLLDFSFIM